MLITGQNKVSNLSRPFPLPTASCRLFLLQQMFQIFVISDAFQLFLNNLFHLLLDAPVIRLHCFLHAVFAILVREVGNDGYRLVGFLLALKLSDTEPTNMPCVNPEILLGGISASICVLMDVETSCRLIEIDCRFCNTFPNRSESVLAVSPTT